MLVVDDSVVVRRLVTAALDGAPGIRVVGTAPNGRVALSKLQQVAPDAVTLDIEMPELDGLATLRELRRTHPRLPVVMFSTLTERGASATLEALALGASDYVTKPANVGSVAESIARVREQLVPRIRALCPGIADTPLFAPAARTVVPAARRRSASATASAGTASADAPRQVKVLAVGCSTGGPEALASVLADLPVPVVVQHMPPLFTKLFAERLDRTSSLRVLEATDDQEVVAGNVYIAPGDWHLEVVTASGRQRTRLHQAPAENFCRPAVDVLFRSVARVYGGSTLAVILTVMGSDGRRGCEPVKKAGGHVIVQDAASSVVWGMPGAVATAGLADEVLPLAHIAGAVRNHVGPRRTAAPAGLTAGRR